MNGLKVFYHGLILIGAWVILLSPTSLWSMPYTGTKDLPNEYCNARYQFCLNYPESVLTDRYESDNGDGIYLFNWDQSVEMWSFGAQNVLNQSLETYHQVMIEELEYGESAISSKQSAWKAPYLESTIWLQDGSQVFIRSFEKTDVIITLMVKLADPRRTSLDAIIDDIRFDLAI